MAPAVYVIFPTKPDSESDWDRRTTCFVPYKALVPQDSVYRYKPLRAILATWQGRTRYRRPELADWSR